MKIRETSWPPAVTEMVIDRDLIATTASEGRKVPRGFVEAVTKGVRLAQAGPVDRSPIAVSVRAIASSAQRAIAVRGGRASTTVRDGADATAARRTLLTDGALGATIVAPALVSSTSAGTITDTGDGRIADGPTPVIAVKSGTPGPSLPGNLRKEGRSIARTK